MSSEAMDLEGGGQPTTAATTGGGEGGEDAPESAAERLSLDALERVLLHLATTYEGNPVDLANAALVGKTWREAAKSPDVWVEMLKQRCYGDQVRELWGEDAWWRGSQPKNTKHQKENNSDDAPPSPSG